MSDAGDRHKPTARLAVEHARGRSEVAWSGVLGARGPSDGSGGAGGNVPSALAVLRHAGLYAGVPAEIEDAFAVLLEHALGHGVLYPAAVHATPHLFEIIRAGSPVAGRVSAVIARYVALMDTLDGPLRARLVETVIDHALDIIGWLGTHDRAAAGIAVHVPALQPAYIAAVEAAPSPSVYALLALLEIGHTAPLSVARAQGVLDDVGAIPLTRAAAAAYLARFGDGSPAGRARIDAALPPSAPAALANLVEDLWQPSVHRPVVAPRMLSAEVVFVGEKLVQVRAGERRVTLPLPSSQLQRGDVIQVGITAHGQPKLALLSEPDGGIRVVDF